MDRFHEHFDLIEDPRAANAQHDLTELLFIALLASLCGADSCADMAEFGLAKESLLRRFMTLKHGVPSHDTFARVFRRLDPQAFEAAFRSFTEDFGKTVRGVVALDGKALRRAYDKGASHMPRAMVTAWASELRLALASEACGQGGEAAAAIKLIEFLDLKGCIVTADALHCRRDTAAAILARGGDYALRIKNNQPKLLRIAQSRLAGPGLKRASGEDGRMAEVAPVRAGQADDFPGLKAIARVISHRPGEEPLERYYALSRALSPKRMMAVARAHWGIENQLHWSLDVTFGEDAARNRKDNAPENLAVLRRMALNIARAHPDKKTSLRRKLLRAGWDETFLFDLIRHMR